MPFVTVREVWEGRYSVLFNLLCLLHHSRNAKDTRSDFRCIHADINFFPFPNYVDITTHISIIPVYMLYMQQHY